MYAHSKAPEGAVATACDSWLTIGEAATKFKCSISSLRNWTREGKLRCFRLGANSLSHRRFRESDLITFFSAAGNWMEQAKGDGDESEGPSVAICGRVSTQKQKSSGDLDRQVQRLEKYAKERWKGKAKVAYFVAVRSGLNAEHPTFVNMIQQVCQRRFKYLLVTYKERLSRFSFKLVETIAKLHGTEIIVTEQQQENGEESAEELVQDLLAITHVFSCKHYSRRAAKTNSALYPQP